MISGVTRFISHEILIVQKVIKVAINVCEFGDWFRRPSKTLFLFLCAFFCAASSHRFFRMALAIRSKSFLRLYYDNIKSSKEIGHPEHTTKEFARPVVHGGQFLSMT
jgi:hypothetical protein